VFSKACCKRLFKMFHLFSDVCCNHFYLNVAYVATICFQMFQLLQSLCSNRWVNVASCKCFILDVSCVSHTCCKSMFRNVLSVFSLILHSCCKCFMLFGRGRARGRRTGDQPTKVLLSRHPGGVLVISCSSQLLSAAHVER